MNLTDILGLGTDTLERQLELFLNFADLLSEALLTGFSDDPPVKVLALD